MRIERPLLSLFKHVATDINAAKKLVRHYISSNEKNAYDQILPVTGYVDEKYRKNPIVLLNHGFSDTFTTTPAKDQIDFILGNNQALAVNGDYLEAETIFRDGGVADEVFELLKAGFLHAWSKWFFPLSEPRYDSTADAIVYDKWGIREYSQVPIGVDSEAVGNEAHYLHALSLVKSPHLKSLIEHGAMKHAVAIDPETIKLQNSLTQLQADFTNIQTELNALKNTDHTKDMHSAIQLYLTNFQNILTPKLEAFANSINKLHSLSDPAQRTAEVQAIVNEQFYELVAQTMGKVK